MQSASFVTNTEPFYSPADKIKPVNCKLWNSMNGMVSSPYNKTNLEHNSKLFGGI